MTLAIHSDVVHERVITSGMDHGMPWRHNEQPSDYHKCCWFCWPNGCKWIRNSTCDSWKIQSFNMWHWNWDASSPAPCGISVVFSHRRHLAMEQLKSHETPLTNQIDKENKRIRTATKNKQVILWNEATDQFEYATTGSGLLFWHSLPCSEALILIHSIRRQCHHPVIIMTNDPTRFQIHGSFVACHRPALPWCKTILIP